MINYEDFAHFTVDQLKAEAKKLSVDIRGNLSREKLIDKIVEASAAAVTEMDDLEPSQPQINKIQEVVTYAERETVLEKGQSSALLDKIAAHYEDLHVKGIHRIDPQMLVKYTISADEKALHLQAKNRPSVVTDVLLMQPLTAILKECDTFYRMVSAIEWEKEKFVGAAAQGNYAPVSLKA